ncbi:hypothetical protein [Catenulispora pinisilvae]|uniref:hypothetical protein n=1 Tax=Catenulispora pinisilvae TaxID=2705253 RepID=UPI0018920601|nr:hypothetical protein [Catenulispora pinisilvae]
MGTLNLESVTRKAATPMNDQPEVGRPNYSAAGSRPSPSPVPRQGGYGGPERGARPDLRAVLAMAAAVLAWSSWTPFYNLPIVVALLAAVFAARWGTQAKRNILAAEGARSGAGLADLARVLGLADLAILAYLIFHYYFVAHAGIKGVLTLLLT